VGKVEKSLDHSFSLARYRFEARYSYCRSCGKCEYFLNVGTV